MSILEDSRIKLTYEDYVEFPDDGKRHEVIDGDHHVTPSPSSYHQTLVMRLAYQLFTQVEEAGKGRVLPSPIDVLLTRVDIVQPDIVVVLEPRTAGIHARNVQCAPELVVEVLSEATVRRDRTLKKSLYERSGVTEYWIVDPDAHTVEQHVLREQGKPYELRGSFGEEIAAEKLPGARIDLRKVW